MPYPTATMALQATRYEYRITLSHVDRGRDVQETVLAARHPSETAEHLTLRVLAWCLLNEDRVAFGPGLSDSEMADLWTRDLTGRLTTWIECGSATAEKVRKIALHNAGIATHVVLDDEGRAAALVTELRDDARLRRRGHALTVWTIDAALVQALAARDQRRQKWTVTIVDGHLYVEVDGEAHDGASTAMPIDE
jgi:uncharacterized protein YaeQ